MRSHGTALDRRQFLRQSAALGLASLVAPTLATRTSAATKDRIVIYQGVSLDSLHPYGYSGGGITGIWRHIIEPLIQMDYDRNEFVGVLAQSWEFQGRKWIFHLRKGVRFHNGAPFTSKDVAFSIDKLQNDKRSLQGAYVQGIEVDTPDDYTVVLTTKSPNALLLTRLETRFMLSKEYGDDLDKATAGTGPYKYVSWQRGGNLVLQRNNEYWGPEPQIREVIIKGVKEEAARVAGLLAGQADLISNVPIEDVDRIAKHPRVRIQKVVGFRMYFLGMNVQMKPFDNKLLRQAINYALDPRVMLKHIYEGHGAVVNGPLGSNWVGFDPKIKRYPYDPKKARELLTQAGYPNGLEIKLYLAPDRHLKGKEVCEVIADQLGKVGIKVELVPQEYAIYWGKDGVNGGKLPFYYAGSNGSDADVYFEQYFRTGGSKRINYNNPEFDKLIDEEQRTGDQKKRVAILHQAGRILMEDVPFAPLYTLAELYGVQRNVIWKGSPDGKILAADMKIKG
jgi:peptide/nickel transport system substrate-binding protein